MFWTWQHSSTEVKKCTEVHLPGNSAVGTINLSATTVTGIGSTSLVLCLLYVYIWTLCQMSLCDMSLAFVMMWQRIILYALNADWCFPLCPACVLLPKEGKCIIKLSSLCFPVNHAFICILLIWKLRFGMKGHIWGEAVSWCYIQACLKKSLARVWAKVRFVPFKRL